MLLEFSVVNFKSFCEKMVFSLEPAPKQKGLDYSILKEKIGRKKYQSLCSAVIYGANASGKTNIISAIDAFKAIVLRGHIRNDDVVNSPNDAAFSLELIPNNSFTSSVPTEFGIKFITDGLIIEYSFLADLGIFLDDEYQRKILSETLYINESMIFERKESLKFGSINLLSGYLLNAFEQNEDSAKELAASNLIDDELFLMNGFKSLFSSKIAAIIADWLDKKFMVIYRADALNVIRKFSEPKKNSIYVETTLNKAAASFGINSNALGYVVDSEGTEAKLCSMFKGAEKGTIIPAELFESLGTIRFVNLFPLVVRALLHGGTLVIDEFDASIHPMALMNIVNIFHNDEINVNRAQLIFNTHNPIFLNCNLFRRDEIKFVERDDDTHYSSSYSLSDFGTSGKRGVRNNDDYMKNYFVDRYGAIKDIDFSPIIESLIKKQLAEREADG